MRISVAAGIAAALMSAAVASKGELPKHRIVAIVVPGLQAADFETPELAQVRSMFPTSAVGWMVARTAGAPGNNPSSEAVVAAELATLGAGARAAPPDIRLDWGPCGDGFGQTAMHASAASAGAPDLAFLHGNRDTQGERVALGRLVQQMREADRQLEYPVYLGALGSAVRHAGWRTAAGGDTGPCTGEDPAPLLCALDGIGETDGAATGLNSIVRNGGAPFGCETSFRAYQQIRDYDFGVYAFGDLVRAQSYAPLCTPGMAARHRARALARLAHQVMAAWRGLGPRDVLFVIGIPASASADYSDLAPVIMAGSGVDAGFLISPSTHRLGVVANTDFLPTVLGFMGAQTPVWAEGRAFRGSGKPASFDHWLAVYRDLTRTARLQGTLGGLPGLQLLLALVIAADAAGMSGVPWLRWASVVSAGAILALPAAELLLPLAHPGSVLEGGLMLACVLLAAGAAGLHRAAGMRMPAILLGMLIVPIAVDLVTGGHLLQQAWMGSSVTLGARFFGIGNEYGAALLAALFVTTGCGFAWWTGRSPGTGTAGGARALHPRWAAGLALVLVAFGVVVGAPTFGANFGCAAAFFVAAAAIALQYAPVTRRLAWSGAAIAGVLLLAALVMAGDLLRPPAQQTHLGRVLTHPSDALVIARRKVGMNFRLALHSVWSGAGLAACAAVWLARRRKRLAADPPGAGILLAGFVWGAAAMLVFNDSGVVAAAEMMLLGAAGSWLLLRGEDLITATGRTDAGARAAEADA